MDKFHDQINYRFETHDPHRAAGSYEYEYESDPEEEGETDSEVIFFGGRI